MRLTSIFLAASLLGISVARAEAPPSPVNLELQTEFRFKNGNKSLETKTTTPFAANNRLWTPLTKKLNGVVLLARIAENSNKTVKIEYIVVDTDKDESIVSTPIIVTNLEGRAELKSGSKDGLVEIVALPHETSITK